MTDETDGIAEEEVVDTTDGTRDPLSTDEGLVAFSATIPDVPADRPAGQDADPSEDPGVPLPDQCGLDVAEDGTDPCAAYAVEED